MRYAQANGTLLPFSRDALFISLYESCKHRETAIRDASNLAQQVIRKLTRETGQPGLITRAEVITACTDILTPFDATATAVYAAYHK